MLSKNAVTETFFFFFLHWGDKVYEQDKKKDFKYTFASYYGIDFWPFYPHPWLH